MRAVLLPYDEEYYDATRVIVYDGTTDVATLEIGTPWFGENPNTHLPSERELSACGLTLYEWILTFEEDGVSMIEYAENAYDYDLALKFIEMINNA